MFDDFPIFAGELEIRARGDRRVLGGRFPYSSRARARNGDHRKSPGRSAKNE